MTDSALHTAEILLPKPGADMEKWAVVACDQYTAQPEYWREAEKVAGDAPSALNLILPEAWLEESRERIPAIHQAMADYLSSGTLVSAVPDGFVLTERTTPAGVRPGLVVALDLEAYDFSKGSESLIRATEGTVLERVPPRARIRAGAPLELPHVMMLIDDPECTVIEPLLARREALRPLYDFELMLGGGHLRGWAVEGEDAQAVFKAVDALNARADGLLYAVGDGNHSLAAAKQCWTELRPTLTPEERLRHPARFALVELVALEDEALEFEPIYRVVECDTADFLGALNEVTAGQPGAQTVTVITAEGEKTVSFAAPTHALTVGTLQEFIDGYAAAHPGTKCDYIHDEASLRALANRPGSVGFLFEGMAKEELFPYVRDHGTLPRKTFSMGEARSKRYYIEARKIVK